ncbi:MAG: hypothetical protein U0892_03405 [Pirellulales bacterium]
MTQRILCIWLPNWPVQRALRVEPELAGRALILETRDARRGLVVAAANLHARRSGARIGMRMSELAAWLMNRPALLLNQRTALASTQANASSESPAKPFWEVRSYRSDEDLDALCELCERAGQFSPIVGLEMLDPMRWAGREHVEPQCILADVSGTAHLFENEHGLLLAASRWLKSEGYFAYMAISSTIGAAWAMANYELRRTSRRETTLRVSIPMEQDCEADSSSTAESIIPDSRGLITEMWEEEELLAELPTAALRIDEDTVDKLSRLGIRRPMQIWQLPRDGLATRLGAQLLLRSDQALGNADESITVLHVSPEMQADEEIEFPTSNRDTIRELIHRQCATLCSRMQREGKGALRIVCRMDVVSRPPLLMNLGLYAASNDCEHLVSLLDGQLDVILNSEQGRSAVARTKRRDGKPEPPSQSKSRTGLHDPRRTDAQLADAETLVTQYGVWRIAMQIVHAAPVQWQQSELFDDAAREHRRQLGRLIDKLSSRLGRDNVLEARIERNAEPESAASFRPLTGRRRDGRSESTVKKLTSRLAHAAVGPTPNDPLRRPTQLLHPPQAILATGDGLPSSPPASFTWNDRRYYVVRCWGPERLESGWWKGPSMRREYFRVECSGGEWFWIYHDLTAQRWYMNGLYG